MITKIIYFRPDKRLVHDEDLSAKYTCLIRDEFTSAENYITVPAYLTVFQHHVPKVCSKSGKQKLSHKKLTSFHFLEKICFYLVGSKQAPLLTEILSNVRNVDRIEFKGHMGFEGPIFESISQLPALRKISFFINPCKQKQFLVDSNVNTSPISASNLLVTNVKIEFEKCVNTLCCCNTSKLNDPNPNEVHEIIEEYAVKCEDKFDSGLQKTENLKIMIIRLLERMVKQCPNIKKLCMDVPNYTGVRKVIEAAIKDLVFLKPTNVSFTNDNITVRKFMANTQSSNNEHSKPSIGMMKLSEGDNLSEKEPYPLNPERETSQQIMTNDKDEQLGSKSVSIPEEPEPTPCLFDMSKLLGSMLGIPTSSLAPPLPSPSTGQHLSNTLTIGPCQISGNSNATEPQNEFQPHYSIGTVALSTNVTAAVPKETTVDCSMNPTATNQSSTILSSLSSTEVAITYAAAAASASAAATNTTATSTSYNHRHHHHLIRGSGNDIGDHHLRLRYHHINEGSRRTFLGNGEGPVVVDEEEAASNKNKKRPTVPLPHVADLGKPVFVPSTSSKSPHKRGSSINK